MKTALYFEDKEAQLVLTPETEWEKTIVKMIHASYPEQTRVGGFYECKGGWFRQTSEYNRSNSPDSLMFRMPKIPTE